MMPVFMPRVSSRKKSSASSSGMSYTSGNVIFVPSLRAMVIGSGFSAMSSRSATEMMFFGLSPAMVLPFRVFTAGDLLVGLHGLDRASGGLGLGLTETLRAELDLLPRVRRRDRVLAVLRNETSHGGTPCGGIRVRGWCLVGGATPGARHRPGSKGSGSRRVPEDVGVLHRPRA